MQDPEQLREAIVAIIPEFREAWDEGEVPGSYAAVMLAFTGCFGRVRDSLSPRQLAEVGHLLNCAILDAELEKAVATCFLEHLHQIRGWHALKPYLSPAARGRSRA